MNEVLRWSGGMLLGVLLACTVGEAPPDASPAPASEETGGGAVTPPNTPWPDTTAVTPSDPAAPDGASQLLAAARLAYDAGDLERAVELSDRLRADHAHTPAATGALWVAARAAFGLGRYESAARQARAFADVQPAGSQLAVEAERLERLARDAALRPGPETPVLGVILPRSGSRILVRYADWLLEGIELAVREAERQQGRRIQLVVADDSGGARTARAIAELERAGALAVVGPMLPQQLPLAAGARSSPDLVLVTPTVPESPAHWPNAYTVAGGDTRGAQELGRYAAEVGLKQAALLYPRSPEFEQKARAFAVEFETMGGVVRAAVPYDSGTTTFSTHMTRILEAVAPVDTLGVALGQDSVEDTLIVYGGGHAASDTLGIPRDSGLVEPIDPNDPWRGLPPQEPFALFVAAPERDVPQIAPQIAFYGLDSAGVQVFGDEAWTAAGVRRVVTDRDLEGVIAASNFPADRADAVADPDFVRLYETDYRRSLPNQLPALGYDAAHLVLQALPTRMLTPEATAWRFDFLTGIRGATGVLSVRAGRVVRTPFLVVIRNGGVHPAPYPWEYQLPVPEPPLPSDSAAAEGGAAGR